ncbi:MAG: C25 family cysteine peptidase [Candidatus Contendobacter sp.]|nr:C25 family cysteine peptidase [Candidatus Contendobacter sp.]
MANLIIRRKGWGTDALGVLFIMTLTLGYIPLASATQTGTWTFPGTPTAQTTSGGSVTTVQATVTGVTWTDLSNRTLDQPLPGGPNPYIPTSMLGANGWQFTVPNTGTGTLTFTFSNPVANPIIHVDRLGGYSNGTNSARFTLTSPGTLTKLSGVGHLNVQSSYFERTTGTTGTNATAECNNIGSGDGIGTACGSIRVNGTYTTLSFTVTRVGQNNADTLRLALSWNQDLGDAPQTYGRAIHAIPTTPPSLYLGTVTPDDDPNGAEYSAAATIDNTTGVNDEDGVASFPPSSTPAGVYTVNVAYTNNTSADARLCGWIDFDKGGTFDADERACATVAAGASSTNLAFTVPTADRNRTGSFYARFRIASTTSEAEAPTGPANNGEVEDYQITNIESLPITLSSVDARQSPSGLVVEWTTATETRNAGFHLYGRMTGESDWQRLTTALIPSKVIDSLEPQRYAAAFPRIVADELLIEDWDTQGQTRRHGPFAVGRKHGFDAVAAAKPINWAAIHAENEQTERQTQSLMRTFSAAGTPDALLWVTQSGVQRVTFSELQAAGANFSGVAIADLALTDAGRKQPRYVIDANNNGRFDSGDTVEFLGQVTPTLYSARNAYRLAVNRSLVSEANSQSLDPKNAVSGVFSHEVKVEQQRAYSFAAPGNDPWYDQWLFAYTSPVSLERTFDLPGYAGGEARLTLRHWGVTDWPGDAPDHHLIVKINGQQVDEARFDGSVDASRTLALSGVQATGNTLILEAPGDTGYDYDIQALDGFTVQYKRHTQAHNGAWQGELPTDAKTLIVGFQGESVAWRNAQRRVGGEQLIVSGQGAWVAADSRAIRRPTIQTELPTPAAKPTAAAVDYLIISHALFIDSPAMNDLVALQKSRGYRTAVVNVDTIYAAYSDFEVSADAIGRYLKQAKPRFVLLVGGDSHDYHNYLGLASQSFVPTRYAQTDALVTYAPADGWYVDYNNDGKPQAALGRLPVRTVAELSQVVAKIINAPLLKHAVLGAGPSDDGRQFATINADYAAQLPSATWTRQLIAVDERGLDAARSALQTELNLGGALISYIGHSSYALWGLGSDDTLFSAAQARQLANPTPHLVTQWGCWNTYFVNPSQDTMANALLFQSRGASAVLGATALTDIGVLNGLGSAFFKQLGQRTTLGEALQAAQRTYLNQNPTAASSLRGFALLGDPAAPIR